MKVIIATCLLLVLHCTLASPYKKPSRLHNTRLDRLLHLVESRSQNHGSPVADRRPAAVQQANQKNNHMNRAKAAKLHQLRTTLHRDVKEVDEGSCTSDEICKNGGTCYREASCYCPSGFSGWQCEEAVPTNCDDPTTCQNGGTCRSETWGGDEAYVWCECPYEAWGTFCEEMEPTSCDDIECKNGGACIHEDYGDWQYVWCDCPSGKGGVYCEEDEPTTCDPSPCENGGTCRGEQTWVYCECPEDYWGSLCKESYESYDVQTDCTADFCQNAGTCEEYSYCQCTWDYWGPTCEDDWTRSLPARRISHRGH